MSRDQISRDAIREQVFAVIAEQIKTDVANIHDESTLRDLGVSSLDAIEIIFDIEDRFGITFPEKEGAAGFDSDTAGELIDAVIAAGPAAAADEGRR